MQPIETIEAFAPDISQAVALWKDHVRQQLPPEEDWQLVSVQVQPVMRPKSNVNLLSGNGQPQMEMAVVVIGFFQKEESGALYAERSARAGYEAVTGCKKHIYMDGRCVYCGIAKQ